MVRLLLALELVDDAAAVRLGAWLEQTGVRVTRGPAETAAMYDAVLVLRDRPLDDAVEDALLAAARSGTAVLLAGPTVRSVRDSTALLDAAGVVAGDLTPHHEMRIGDLFVDGSLLLLDKVADDVEILRSAAWRLSEHAVATIRRDAGVVATFTLEDLDDARVRRELRKWLGRAIDPTPHAPIRVGLLGYGAIGAEHALAIGATPGLELAAVCDRSATRLDAALALAPDATPMSDAAEVIAAETLDLVIVSTPPVSHATWAVQALQAGKHVVVEKPFSLTVAEVDEMLESADAAGRTIGCYQNRRFDADYVALRQAVRSGAIGDVFHLESFVGGYGHPCSYWHSDEAVSGGAVYDWGSHHLDWALDLVGRHVAAVSSAAHKRVWHDVTNADHSRVTVHFVDGAEAVFVHSDLAAAPKPKWYVLGTRGAITGAAQRPDASDAPTELTLATPDGTGGVHETRLSIPHPAAQPYHRELADYLLTGIPMSVTPEQSRTVVAVMEAATESARSGSRLVPLPS